MKHSDKTTNSILRQKAEGLLKLQTATVNDISTTEAEMIKLIHELRVHQIELELQNEELALSKQHEELALQKSEEKYRQLAESSTILVYRILLKPEFKFEYVSPSATAITGYTPEDHYNDPQLGFKLVHPDDRILLENTTRYSKGEPLELRWIRKDGLIIWTEQRNVLLFDENNEPYAIEGNARDITDSKNIELGLRKEAERNSLLLDLFAKAPALTDKELYDKALDIAVKITESAIGFFHQVSDNQQEIILTTWNDEAKKNCNIVYDNHYPIQKAGNWADCVRQKKAVIYNDYPLSPNKQGLPEGHAPIGRTMSVPVVDNEKVRLIFGVGNKPSDYTDSDVIQIQAIANEMHKILEKRKVENNLKKIEDRWQFAIEGSTDGIWDWNVLTGDVFYSNRWKEMIGYGPAELEGNLSEWQTRVHPDDIEAVKFKLQQHFNRETPDYAAEHRILCKDGSWKWILDRGKVLEWTDDGKPVRMVGTHSDIAEQKLAVFHLKEAEVQYRNLANIGSALIWTSGKNKLCNYFNEPWLKFTGRTLEQEMGNGWAEGVYPEDFDRCLDTYITSFDKREPFEMEYRLRHSSGDYKWIVDLGTPNFNSNGEFIGYIGHCFDISERKKTELALHESEERYRSIFISVQEVYFEASMDGTLLEISPSIEIISRGQFMRNEMIGQSFAGIYANPEDRNRYFSKLIEQKRVNDYELSLRNKDGSLIPVAISSALSFDANGKPLKITGILRDITERKNTENTLNETLRKLHETNLHLEKRVEERTAQLAISNENLKQENVERHKVTIALQESLQRLNKIADRVPGVVYQFRLNPDGTSSFPFASEGIKDIYRVSPEEVAHDASTVFSRLHPDDFDGVVASIKESAKELSLWSHEYRVKFDDGTVCWLAGNAMPLLDADGSVLWHGFITDISERKEAETAIKMQSAAFESFALTIIITDIKGRIKWVNPAFTQLTGFSVDDAIGKTPGELIKSGKQDKYFYKSLWDTLLNKKVWSGELINRRKDGSLYYEEETITPVLDSQGNISSFIAIKIDITERKKLYQELADEKRRMADIIKGTNLGTWEWNVQTGETRFNEQWANMIGYTLDEISPASIETWMKFAHPDDLKTSGELMEKHFKGEFDYYSFESRMKHKNGEWMWVLDRGKVHVWDDEGKPLLMSGTHQDITARKQVEDDLKESTERHRGLSEAAFDSIFFSEKGVCIEQNQMAEKIFGYTNEEAIGKYGTDWIVESDRKMVMDNMLAGLEDPYEVTALRKDGTTFPCMLSGRMMYYKGRIVRVTSLSDITQRKQAETALIKAKSEAEKANHAKSEFLSRMSHELRTPMNSILGFAQLMEMGELNPKQKKGVKHIMNNGRHLLSLINDVLDISGIEAGRQMLAPEPIQLAAIINEITDSVQVAASNRKVSIVLVDSPVNSLFALADRLRLKQVLINLFSNAIKYNNVGGSVTIKTALQPTHMSGNTYVRISICDTGNGIKPGDIGKLFQPFERIGADQTETEGTGLGLMVVKKLTEAMGGIVGVESEVGTGSTFWIELPLTENHKQGIRQTGGSPTPELPVTKQDSTILYIEDNLSNIELVEEIMAQYLPEISLVTSKYGRETLKLAKEHKPGLIMLDLNLPDVQGFEVLEQLLADANTKAIPVIIISADAMPFQVEKLMKAGAMDYLTKPLDIIQFLKTVEQHIKI